MKKRPPKARKTGASASIAFRLLLLLCFAALLVSAQQPKINASRTVEGMVTDHEGNAAPGAVVLIKDVKTLQVRSYIVQEDGKYHFHGLNPDANYELRARLNGVASGSKMVNVFDTKPVIEVNLKLPEKAKS